MPPAKSSAPSANNQPVGAHTQWVTGAYTIKTHSAINTIQALNLIRSATEPLIIATAIMAKVIWKIANKTSGIVPLNVSVVMPSNNSLLISPSHKPPSPNAKEYPTITQTTVTIAAALKLCPIVAKTFFLRTIPP